MVRKTKARSDFEFKIGFSPSALNVSIGSRWKHYSTQHVVATADYIVMTDNLTYSVYTTPMKHLSLAYVLCSEDSNP